MSIIPAYTYTLTNGTTADANQVMANFNTVLTNVNNNAATNGTNSNITQITGLTTPLTVGQGGTGLGTLTANGLIIGNGTSTPTFITTSVTNATAFWNGSAWTTGLLPIRSYLAGLTLSNDGSTPNSVLDISAGICTDSTNIITISLGAFTKSTAGSWTAGTGQDGMGAGLTISATTWYHVFAIINSGAADVYFDTSVTAANKPSNTTAFRRIGSFLTDGSAHIIAFTQTGNYFRWKTYVREVNVVTPGVTTANTVTLSSVPTGVIVRPDMLVSVVAGVTNTDAAVLLSSLSENDQVATNYLSQSYDHPLTTAGPTTSVTTVWSNTSAQIRSRVNQTDAAYNLYNCGWYDTLGMTA